MRSAEGNEELRRHELQRVILSIVLTPTENQIHSRGHLFSQTFTC